MKLYFNRMSFRMIVTRYRGNPVHWSSRIRRVWEGVPPFGVLYAALPYYYTRWCFQKYHPDIPKKRNASNTPSNTPF